MKKERIKELGMELTRFYENGSEVVVAEDDDWATVYRAESLIKGKGYMQSLLLKVKEHYKGKKFGGSIALSPEMSHIYKKLGIKEYNDDGNPEF